MRPFKFSLFGTLVLATAISGGCSKSTASGGDFPGTPNNMTPDVPDPDGNTPNNPNPPGPTAKYAGIYEANAPIDFTQNGVLPGLTSSALNALTLVDTNPGQAIVEFAEDAGTNFNVGPFNAKSIVGGFLDTQLNNLLPPDVKQALGMIAAIADITKTGVLKNKLTVHTPKPDHSVVVDLEIIGASFDFINLVSGTSQHVDVTMNAAQAAAAKTTLTATLLPRANAPVADADLTMSGGTVTIPLGDFMLQAMGPLLFLPAYGVNTLGEALRVIMMGPCGDIGTAVGNAINGVFGINPGPSLGNGICMIAVNLAAAQIIAQITDIKVEGVTITNGRAVLYDISPVKPMMDHQSDRLAEGTWTWSFGTADVPSTLAGNRIGDAI